MFIYHSLYVTKKKEKTPKVNIIIHHFLFLTTEKRSKYYKNQAQFFLACLLASLVKQPHFCFVGLLIGLIVGLAIDGAVLMTLEITIGLSGSFL